jgi:hypothetical protein
MIDWIRIAIYAAIVAAIVAAAAVVRSHWIDEGAQQQHLADNGSIESARKAASEVQRQWDAQKLADANARAALEEQARANDNLLRLNAERTADEAHRRDQARAARLADAERTAAGLRDAITKLDADDLSEASADPRVAAIARRAVAARQLLGSCQSRYASVAAAADRHRDQATGLRDFALNVCHAGVPARALQEENAQ